MKPQGRSTDVPLVTAWLHSIAISMVWCGAIGGWPTLSVLILILNLEVLGAPSFAFFAIKLRKDGAPDVSWRFKGWATRPRIAVKHFRQR
jgi:hypothetical protein